MLVDAVQSIDRLRFFKGLPRHNHMAAARGWWCRSSVLALALALAMALNAFGPRAVKTTSGV